MDEQAGVGGQACGDLPGSDAEHIALAASTERPNTFDVTAQDAPLAQDRNPPPHDLGVERVSQLDHDASVHQLHPDEASALEGLERLVVRCLELPDTDGPDEREQLHEAQAGRRQGGHARRDPLGEASGRRDRARQAPHMILADQIAPLNGAHDQLAEEQRIAFAGLLEGDDGAPFDHPAQGRRQHRLGGGAVQRRHVDTEKTVWSIDRGDGVRCRDVVAGRRHEEDGCRIQELGHQHRRGRVE
ncbi:hypothetical protein [Streptomyces xantholiticus]|uniref:hypothetical protein n=1 Tax=Streptomyces xantholiticus TaxID=68285 RepID=UPI001677AE5A|nr:hypothetical protein [Streptomyces xantholiticus]